MSAIKIDIETGNAAFRDEDGSLSTFEVARILRLLASRMEHDGAVETNTPIYDVFGNRVGMLEVVE